MDDSKAPGAESVLPGDGGRGGLLFAWSHSGPAVHLGVFIAASLVAHLLGFYLFQVVYPSSGRLEPVPERIVLLDASEPAVASLMRQINDRLVFLRPGSESSVARVSLSDYAVRFSPSYPDYRPGFKVRSPLEVTASVPRPEPGARAALDLELVLPPVDRSVQALDGKGGASRAPDALLPPARWKLGGGLAGRALEKGDVFAGELDTRAEAGTLSGRLMLGVDAAGRVRHVMPAPGAENGEPRSGETPEMRQWLRERLRFAPKPGAEIEWGEWEWVR